MSYWNTVFVVLLIHLIFVSGWPLSNVTQTPMNSDNRTSDALNITGKRNLSVISNFEKCKQGEQLDHLNKCKEIIKMNSNEKFIR